MRILVSLECGYDRVKEVIFDLYVMMEKKGGRVVHIEVEE